MPILVEATPLAPLSPSSEIDENRPVPAVEPPAPPPTTLGAALARVVEGSPRSEPPPVRTEPRETVFDSGLILAERLGHLLECRRTEDERRTFPRRMSGCVVTIVPAVGNLATGPAADWRLRAKGRRGALVDLSLSSAAVSLTEPLEQGDRVLARLECRTRGATLDVTGRVLRCIPLEDEYRVVVSLGERLTLDEILAFGHQAGSQDVV